MRGGGWSGIEFINGGVGKIDGIDLKEKGGGVSLPFILTNPFQCHLSLIV